MSLNDNYESAKLKLVASLGNNSDVALTNMEAQALYNVIESISLVSFTDVGSVTKDDQYNIALKLRPDLRADYLAARFRQEYIPNKFNHLFELPLSREAAYKLDSLKKSIHFMNMSNAEFSNELKKSEYWLKFNPL